MLQRLLFLCLTVLLVNTSKAQWATVDLIDFNGAAYESNIVTGGTAYWDLAVNPPSGPRNGLINGTWEVTNTGLGATQSPSNTANGRFLMYWSDQDYTGSSPAAAGGTVWSKTYTGLIPGKTYRYSFKSGYLICPSCTAPAGASLPSLRVYLNGTQVSVLPAMTASWSSFSYTFTAASASQTLSIYNTSGAVVGNDFGLDDIKLEVGAVVPVKLSSFSVKKDNDCGNRLDWKTESEINFKQFEVLKSSDGNIFKKTGIVIAGSNIAGSSYSFTDKNDCYNKSFYRLLMEDLDGNTQLSDVMQISGCTAAPEIIVFPNPAAEKINISGLKTGSIVQISDAAGRVVISKAAGGINESILIDHLPKAVYFITITDGSTGQKNSSRFVKD
jgi:hypothetical protein